MATRIYEGNNITITQYWGGDDRGQCLQIMMQDSEHAFKENLIGATQLDLGDAIELYNELGAWIKDECQRRQKILRDEIKDMKELEKTVFHEVAHLSSQLLDHRPLAAELILKFTPASKRKEP